MDKQPIQETGNISQGFQETKGNDHSAMQRWSVLSIMTLLQAIDVSYTNQ